MSVLCCLLSLLEVVTISAPDYSSMPPIHPPTTIKVTFSQIPKTNPALFFAYRTKELAQPPHLVFTILLSSHETSNCCRHRTAYNFSSHPFTQIDPFPQCPPLWRSPASPFSPEPFLWQPSDQADLTSLSSVPHQTLQRLFIRVLFSTLVSAYTRSLSRARTALSS